MVERSAVNRMAAGSSPVLPAKLQASVLTTKKQERYNAMNRERFSSGKDESDFTEPRKLIR